MDTSDVLMDYFKCNRRLLRIVGLWMPDRKHKWSYYLLCAFNIICITYSIIIFTIFQLMSLPTSAGNIKDLVKNLNMSISFILTMCKASAWFIKRKQIIRIMTKLETTWKVIFADAESAEIMQRHQLVKDRLMKTFFALALCVPTSACIMTYIDLYVNENLTVDGNVTLPYHSYVPFEYKSSKKCYFGAVVYQCVALLSCGMITVGFDMLYTAIVGFVACHFDLLQHAFRNLHSSVWRKHGNAANFHQLLEREMVVYLKHLQLILKICKEIESIFCYLILLQMLVSLLVFCTCLYLVSMLPVGMQIFGNELAYMLAIENQLAIYCYAGNNLTYMASKINFAIYDNDWMDASIKFKGYMIFTMMRMLKPIHLSAGKFTPLTLSTFVTIGRGSYSLLAVLKS